MDNNLPQEAYTRVRHIDELDMPILEQDPELEEIKELREMMLGTQNKEEKK